MLEELETEKALLEICDTDLQLDPSVYDPSAFWSRFRACAALAFPTTLSKLIENPNGECSKNHNAAKVISAVARRRIELGMSVEKEVSIVSTGIHNSEIRITKSRDPSYHAQPVPATASAPEAPVSAVRIRKLCEKPVLTLDKLKCFVREAFDTSQTDYRFGRDLKDPPPFDERVTRTLTTIEVLGVDAADDAVRLKLLVATLKRRVLRYLTTEIAPRMFMHNIPDGNLADAGSLK